MSAFDNLDQALESLEAPGGVDLAPLPVEEVEAVAPEMLGRLAELMEHHLKPLAKSISMQSGKPLVEARAEVEEAVWTIDLLAQATSEAGAAELLYDPYRLGWLGFLRREPYRVVGAITGASFPLLMPVLAAVPALIAGCGVVLKPAQVTNALALEFLDLWRKAGGNGRQIAVLQGPGDELGPALCANPRIEALVAYCSRKTALAIQRVARFKPTSLHFGGIAVAAVGKHRNLKQLAEELVSAAFAHNGQVAYSPKLVLASPANYTKMRKLLAQRILDLKSGAPLENRTDLGPLPSQGRAETMLDGIERVVQNGGQLVCGGKHSANFVLPTLLGLEDVSGFLNTELSGPVLAIAQFDGLDALPEVLGPQRDLAVSIFDTDDVQAAEVARQLRAQTVYINNIPHWQEFVHSIHQSAIAIGSQAPPQLFNQVQTQQRGYQYQ